MSIAFDASSNSGYQSAQSTYSWSHTCTGNLRFLAVNVHILSVPGTTVSGITHDGVAMTLIGVKSTVSGAGRVECWGLVSPATGVKTIAVTLSASVASAGTAVSYTGVNQSTPTETFNSAQATNVGAADATVTVTTSTDNDWIHTAVVTDDTAITANQTSRNNVTGALGSGANEDSNSVVHPAGVATGSYTAVAALATWAIGSYGIVASASILTIGSLSLANDGKTLTATISGGTGTGYSPALGVTGLVVSKTSGVATKVKIASTAISSTTLTLVLDTTLGSAETLAVDIDAASNLTDSGSNTATGQSSVSVTNTSTQHLLAVAGSGFLEYIAGRVTAEASVLGHTYVSASSVTELNLVVTNLASLSVAAFGGDCTVTVDGGSPVTKTSTSPANFELVGLTGSLDDTVSHTIKLNLNELVATDIMFHATGTTATPTIAIAPTYGKQVVVGEASCPYIARDSFIVVAAAYHVASCLNAGSFRCSAKCSTIRMFQLGATRYRVWVDGVAGSFATTADVLGLVAIATGRDDTAYHAYRFEILTFFTESIFSFMFDGDGLQAVIHDLLTGCWGWYGDSITQGIAMASPELNHPYLMGEAHGIAPLIIGTSGNQTYTGGRDGTAEVTGRLQISSAIWVNFITNDVRTGVSVPNFEAAYVDMLKNLRSDLHARSADSTRLYCQAMNDSALANTGSPKTYAQARIDAIATVKADVTVNGRDKIYDVNSYEALLNPLDWDGTHPVATQQATIVAYQTPYMADLGYSRSGTSGTVTVTVATGGAFDGRETVTLTASAGTITATAASGSISGNGTDTVIVTPAFNATSFTYTATSNATITYTNGQGWVDPATTSYSATDTTPPTVLIGKQLSLIG